MSSAQRPSFLRRLVSPTSERVGACDPGDMGTAIALEYILDEPLQAEMEAARRAETVVRSQAKRHWWQRRGH